MNIRFPIRVLFMLALIAVAAGLSAQAPPPPPPPPLPGDSGVPFDGGIFLLIAAFIAGAKRILGKDK